MAAKGVRFAQIEEYGVSSARDDSGTQITCFTSTKVQKMTLLLPPPHSCHTSSRSCTCNSCEAPQFTCFTSTEVQILTQLELHLSLTAPQSTYVRGDWRRSLILLYMGYTVYVPSYYYICARIGLRMCPHANRCVLILLYMRPHATRSVASYICVRILLRMCPHTIYVSSYCYICVLMPLAATGAGRHASSTGTPELSSTPELKHAIPLTKDLTRRLA